MFRSTTYKHWQIWERIFCKTIFMRDLKADLFERGKHSCGNCFWIPDYWFWVEFNVFQNILSVIRDYEWVHHLVEQWVGLRKRKHAFKILFLKSYQWDFESMLECLRTFNSVSCDHKVISSHFHSFFPYSPFHPQKNKFKLVLFLSRSASWGNQNRFVKNCYFSK